MPFADRGQRLTPAEEKERRKRKKPKSGKEYYFSNTCIKVEQVSSMFIDTADDHYPESASFIVLVWEKSTRKRFTPKRDDHFLRMKKMAAQKKEFNGRRYED